MKNGYLQYVDYANFHPYQYTAAGQEEMILGIRKIFAGRPITSTEWNFQFPGSKKSWAEQLKIAHPLVEQGFESAFYYKFVTSYDSQAAPAGLVLDDGHENFTPHQPFYDLYKSWHAHAQ